jgi:hypothetical protein
VGDEQHREIEAALHVVEKVEHLSLDRDVEGRDGLVGDQELRAPWRGPGDGDALALAAGELVRDSGRGRRARGRRAP